MRRREARRAEAPLLDRERFDLVLLDLGLPRQDGYSVLAAVRAAGDVAAAAAYLPSAEEDGDESVAAAVGGLIWRRLVALMPARQPRH